MAFHGGRILGQCSFGNFSHKLYSIIAASIISFRLSTFRIRLSTFRLHRFDCTMAGVPPNFWVDPPPPANQWHYLPAGTIVPAVGVAFDDHQIGVIRKAYHTHPSHQAVQKRVCLMQEACLTSFWETTSMSICPSSEPWLASYYSKCHTTGFGDYEFMTTLHLSSSAGIHATSSSLIRQN